jgi:ectoine hydroxylase-related dioxygenase (phytanoyl-CoA dioxygenase family)
MTLSSELPALSGIDAPFTVDDATVEGFRKNGHAVVRGLASAEEIAEFAPPILAQERALAAKAPPLEERSTYFKAFLQGHNLWMRDPTIKPFVFSARFAKAAADLMGVPGVRLYHDQSLTKEPGGGHTPWHQDQPYYNIGGRQNVSFWIPVDPVPLASTLRFVAGSHVGTWFMPRTFRDQQAKWFPEGTLAELPPIDAEPQAYRQLGWALEPGDCVAFHMLSLHASSGTGPGVRRRVFSARYLGDDALHALRPWRTSPPFPGLDQRLPDGAPMDDPLFPLVWS